MTSQPNSSGESAPSQPAGSGDWDSLKDIPFAGSHGAGGQGNKPAISDSSSFGDVQLDLQDNGEYYIKGDHYSQFLEDDKKDSTYTHVDGIVTETVSPNSIEGVYLNDTEVENPERFWTMHNSSKDYFLETASHIPEVQAGLSEGKTLSELRENPDLKDCVSTFFDPEKVPRVVKYDDYYTFAGDGRHRILIAREYGYDIPVRVVAYGNTNAEQPAVFEMYSNERKEKANRAKNAAESDQLYYEEGERQYNKLDAKGQYALHDYTSYSAPYNAPFYESWNKDRIDNFNLENLENGDKIKNLTEALDKCHTESDRMLQRGTGLDDMAAFFGQDISRMSDEELQNLVGYQGRMMPFTSCGSAEDCGFLDEPCILTIYAPEGTKAIYIEPHSALKGNNNEKETLIQRGGVYICTKIERKEGKLYIEFEHHPEKGYLTVG